MGKKFFIISVLLLSFLFQIAFAQALTNVFVNPTSTVTNKGGNFTINVNIDTTESVFGADIVLYFNKTILSATGISEGNFLKKDGATTFCTVLTIDNISGKVSFACTRFNTQTGVTGTGTLFSVNFTGIKGGYSNLSLKNEGIMDSSIEFIPNVILTNGSVSSLTPPSVQSVTITPTNPNTDDTLDCGFVVTDPDPTDTLKANVTWFKNGIEWYNDDENNIDVTSGVLAQTSSVGDIEPSDTAKNDNWVCQVIAYDSLGTRTSLNSSSVTILNSAPTTPTSLALSPSIIYVGNTLTATASGSTDADNDALTYYYEFYNVNDSTIKKAYSTSNTYSIQVSDAHNLIRVRTKAYDGTVYSGEKESTIIISNSAPTTPIISITPVNPKTTDNLVCNIATQSTDADNDVLNYNYAWYKNGVLQSSLTTNTVSSTYTAKNEMWRCNVTASDGTSTSAQATANTTIINSAPLLASIGNKSVIETNLLTFTISATDADSDALTYSVANLPSGATFDSGTKTFSWTPTYDQNGIYSNIIFTVSDSNIVDNETITITVTNYNRVPIIDTYSPLNTTMKIFEGSNISFSHTSHDPDNDILSYKWLVNLIVKATTSSWMYQTTANACTDIGVRNITLVVSDTNNGDASHSWNVIVRMKGDVNYDNKVDIIDLSSVGYSYGTQPGDDNWNASADFNYDDKINIVDLVTTGYNYWRTC